MDRHVKWLRRRIVTSVATQIAITCAIVTVIAFVLLQWRTSEGPLGSLLAAFVIGQIVAFARVAHAMRNNPLNYEYVRDYIDRPFNYRVKRYIGDEEAHPVAQRLPGFVPVATLRDPDADPVPTFDIFNDPSSLVAASVSRASGSIALISSLADGRLLVTDARSMPPHERLVMNIAEASDIETIISTHRRAITGRTDVVELASSAHQVVLDSLTLEHESFAALGAMLSPFLDLEPKEGQRSMRLCARISRDDLMELPNRLGSDKAEDTATSNLSPSQWGFSDVISPAGRATPVAPGTLAARTVSERIVEALEAKPDDGAKVAEPAEEAPMVEAPIVEAPDIAAPVVAAPDIAAPVVVAAMPTTPSPIAISLADHVNGTSTPSPAETPEPIAPAVAPAPPGVEAVPVFAAIDAGAAELSDLGDAPAQITAPEVVELEDAAVAAAGQAQQMAPVVGPSQFKTVEPDHPEHFERRAPITADVPAVVVEPVAATTPADAPEPKVEESVMSMPAPVTVAPVDPVKPPMPAAPVATAPPEIALAPVAPMPEVPVELVAEVVAPPRPATLAEAVPAAPDTAEALIDGVAGAPVPVAAVPVPPSAPAVHAEEGHIPAKQANSLPPAPLPSTDGPPSDLAAAIGFGQESKRSRPRLSAALKAHPAAAPPPPSKRGRRRSR